MTPAAPLLAREFIGVPAEDVLRSAIRIVLVFVVAFVVLFVVRRAIPRAVARITEIGRVDARTQARTRTVSGLLGSVVSVAVWLLAALIVLAELGIPLGPLLAGAGIVGLAVGFGAQQLVRDVISGFFVLVEDQFGVGDYVTAGGVCGHVESLSLRLTRIRGDDGVLHHLRNGDLAVVSNASRGFAVVTVNVAVADGLAGYDATERVRQAMAALVERGDVDGLLLADPQVLGVTELQARSDGTQQPVLTITARATTDGRHEVRRVLLREALAAWGAPAAATRKRAPAKKSPAEKAGRRTATRR